MSKKDEALKLALVAERVLKAWDDPQGMPALCEEMNCLREALADSALDRMAENERELGIQMQPAQQEEKPTTREEILSMAREAGIHVYPEFEGAFELFAALVAAHVRETERKPWVGLTDEEVNACDPQEECWNLLEVSRAIEAKLREKNA